MMVLVDSSVWIDHLHRGDQRLIRLLEAGRVSTHPAIIGELACGSLKNRSPFLAELRLLPVVSECRGDEAMHLLEEHRLWGKGLGWTDLLLLASSRIDGTRLWTRDRALLAAAKILGIAHT